MQIPEWLVAFTGQENLWWMEIFSIVLLTLVVSFCVRVFLDRLLVRVQATKSLWDDALIMSAKQPLRWLFWLIGLSWAADIAALRSDSSLFDVVDPIREVGVIVLLTWFLVRFVRCAEANLLDPMYRAEPLDETTVHAVGKLLRISVIITAVLIVMQSLGYSVSGVLAFGGIGGIAVGFAAKDLLANFFGGLMIYLDRPFAVGDWIRSPDQNIEGTVEEIGWRLTRIRTFDKRPLYIPNSTFTHISVENPSRMTNRRIHETIGIRYSDADKMSVIVERVEAYLRAHEAIDTDQTLIVNFNAFAASSLNFFIYTFTKTTDWIEFHEIKQDVLLGILDIVEKAGAECAFPTSTLHIASGLEGVVEAK
jgi:MscS family membrane protein